MAINQFILPAFFLFAMGGWVFQVQSWWGSILPRIQDKPEQRKIYRKYYKSLMIWGSLPWVTLVISMFMMNNRLDMIKDPLGGPILHTQLVFMMVWFRFLFWVFFQEGAEVLEKYPGALFVPEWDAAKLKYLFAGITLWNVGCVLYFYGDKLGMGTMGGQGFSNIPQGIKDISFYILFPAFWCLISFMIAVMGGWSTLAKFYETHSRFDGEIFRMRSAQIGAMGNYGGCLNFGVNDEGLYVVPIFLFRAGHAPLFIPWRDISSAPVKTWFARQVDLKFEKSPSTPFRISKSLAEILSQSSDGKLPIPPEE